MTGRIRDDLDGVVHLEGGRMLKAGDEIPDEVELGEHLLAASTAQDGKPAGNASLEVWQEYAKSQGMSDEDLDGKSRDDIRDLHK